MDFILFMLFSVIETSAMFYLMFRLFKFDIYPASILFAGLIMAFFSYTMRTQYDLASWDIVLQILLMFTFVHFLFKVHIFYAGIMTSTVYLGYVVIQTAFYFFLVSFGILSIEPNVTSIDTYLLQLLSALTAVVLGLWISKKRKGFDFVPHSQYQKVKFKGINRLFVLLNIPAAIAMTVAYYWYMTNRNLLFFGIGTFLCLLLLILVLYLANKRNYING